jgi:amino acid adenylation domain-containing protein
LNQRDELLAYLLDREGFERQCDDSIPRRDNDESPPPLSFAQERFWFLDQFEHAHPVYNGCKVVRLIGHLRVEVLVECLNLIVRRHEVLRTTYPSGEGRPITRVARACSVEIPITDLGHVSESELPYTIERLARKEWTQPINLSEELPIRARLVRIDHAENLLLLTLHQIASDSQSVAIFFRELWTSYEAKMHGKEPELPILPMQYGDFARWQRDRVSGQIFQSHREYWIQRLSGTLPVLNLPTDKPRPPVQGFEGSRLSIILSETLQLKLKELSRDNGVTLFMTLLAAFKTLLYRYTAQEDLPVGCPVLNRGLPETENLIGSFLNTLVLRTSYAGNPSFREALRRVRETCVDAVAHQDFPFEKLVEELQPQRDLSRNPMFQVMFAFQNTSVPALELPSLRSEVVDIDGGMTKFDLTVSLTDREHGIAGHIEYSTELFNRDTIERIAQHFQTVLEGIVADPDQSIATLPIMSEPERHQVLFQWNDTTADYPKNNCIHELFENQVERTPDAIALEYQDERITYRDLNRKANQLANYLISLGGPEKRIGIWVERSQDMIVGLLGILKAGGAYVPLDPSCPRERLRFMLEDAQASVLLTQEKLVEDRAWRPVLSPSAELRINSVEGMEDGDPRSSILDSRLQVVFLDRDWPLIAQKSDNNTKSRIESHNLAYVIYTSGSTGQPKGVTIAHRSLANCFSAIGKQINLSSQDAWLAVTTIAFDIAALEVFLPLIGGAQLILASRDESVDAELLCRRLEASRATVMQATPSMWKLLLDAGWPRPSNFTVLCGGEELSRQLADRLSEYATAVWNLYGPTESTIWSTMAKITPDKKPISIGRPIANTEIYILDDRLQPMPIGIPGELYIGGDGVARGYFNRPELTAERFVPDPFNDQNEARLYRTGDLARYRPDGNIEFLGRTDNQVKIRGYRIELGEVEAALNQHPEVKDSVVMARPRDSSAERELVGYVVANQDSVASASVLRSLLRQKLPDYMIPSAFVFLNALPLTPNGKVDRSKLPLPDDSRPSLEQGLVEPRSEIEELVAQVWREVLKAERVGVYDDFFDLGGHSLLATRVVARLRANFSIDLPLRKLFELPTVAGLAEHIDFLRRHQWGISVPPIVPVSHDRPIPLSSSQRRLWFLQKLHPGLIAYNIPATFRITGAVNVEALKQALDEVVNRHEILRTRFVEIDGQPLQEILPTAAIELRVIDLSHLSKGQAEVEGEKLCTEASRQPYNLAEAPLMRAELLRLCDDDHVFILNFHHIVCDGSSLIIFYQELASLYEAFLEGKDSNLPSLPIQYADYAVWQHELLQGEALESQLAYWKRQLGTGLAALNLPTDYERPVVQSYRGARLTKAFSEELTKDLKDLSRREGVTLFMTLLATLDMLLSRHTGQTDIIVGSTIAGRNRPETDGLIGFFINALALRMDLSGNPTFPELLKRVREVCLDAYTNQDLPFERVVEEINPQRDLSRNPLFQVIFNMADTSERILNLAGCQIVKLWPSAPEAKFDIVLHAPEVDGRIELAMVYNADLFSEHRIVNMLDQFSYLLSQVVDHPDRGIDEFSLVTRLAVFTIPDPTEPLDDAWEESMHELFAKQAERVPDFPVVIDSDNCWTYRELDQRSNQLANYLIAQGVKPKDIVVIYAQRSAALVVTLLGILKVGAAFVILDPAYPASRLISYLRVATPRAFVHIEGAGETADELKGFAANLHLCCQPTIPNMKLSSETDPLKDYSALDPHVPIHADNPAYVAFTSGSTGEPKGVLSRHGPITHFLPWQRQAFGLVETDRFALLSGLAYNHLHRDIFTTLYLGATLYVPPTDIVREPSRLAEWLRENSISVLHLTPALGQLLLTAGTQPLPAVRRVFFGGDVLTREEVSRIRALAPNATIGSFYGATETQRAVGYYEIPLNFPWKDTEANRPIPLGRGIKDVQLLLLNKAGQLAGVGELAELYVRSPHLAAGYLGDEERTHEMFVINPFTNDSKDRMYKTGELARYLADGNVEWAGRNDRRVNIRGFRVELEEVEAVIKQHPAVQNAAVVLQDCEISAPENLKPEKRNRNLDQRLVAYVVAEEEQQSLVDLLHSYVSTRLPDYMVPSYFVVLDRLPLSPNGKVDYKALPLWEQSPTGQRDSFVAPRNDVEAKLCEIFSQVLGIKQVGVEDNFFRLGGHSLLAVQATARIKDCFGLGLELRTFLESPTVAVLAKHIEIRIRPPYPTPAIDDADREEIEL